MKQLFCLAILSGFSFFGCSSSGFYKENAINLITPELARKHISFLASDSLMGRRTPGPWLDSAAAYISGEFNSCGLKCANGSYFQKVNLGIITLGTGNQLVIYKNGGQNSYKIKTEFTPFEMTANNEVTAPVVFAGYGITAPEYNYDDYKGVDVKDKIVFVMRHEPGEEDSSSVFQGTKPTVYSQVREKVKNAINHGSRGIIIAQDPLNHTSLSPRGFPWPSLSETIPQDALPVSLIGDETGKIPVVQAGKEIINELFGSVANLKELQRTIDAKTSPHSFALPEVRTFLKTNTVVTETPAYNVIGIIEGSDPILKNEAVVIGAHYDHVGYVKDHKPGTDFIFNGADDNASGTGGLLVLAKALGALEQKPKRTIILIAFAGEELGLLGSSFYVNNPVIPIERTVAMLNMDMIGRNNPDSLYIIASSRSPELARINQEENENIGFKLAYNQEQHSGGSDQASFLNKGVPSIFYNTGMEADYHKVSDEVSRIDFTKTSRVAKLVFLTALRIANDIHYNRSVPKQISQK
ncbi:MAG: M28 family peptidase [Ignavibacteriales bacterium]